VECLFVVVVVVVVVVGWCSRLHQAVELTYFIIRT